MPNPSSSDLHVDALLTNVQQAWNQTHPSVALEMAPLVPVQKQSDKYRTWDIGDHTRIWADKRGPTAQAPELRARLSNDSFYCDEYGIKKLITAAERQNDDLGNLETTFTQLLATQQRMRLEKMWATAAFVPGVWTDKTGGVDFTDWTVGGSTPVDDLLRFLDDVESLTGFRPNKVTFGQKAMRVFKRHADVIELLNGGQTPGMPAIATEDRIAQILSVDKVMTARLIETTSAEGAAVRTASQIVNYRNVLAVYVPPNGASMELPSAAYTFAWQGLMGSADGQRIRRYRDETRGSGGSDVIESEAAYATKVTSSSLGVFLINAVPA